MNHETRYASWLQWIMIGLLSIIVVTAFLTSAIRIHHAGVQTFLHGLPHEESARVAGISMVMLAEFSMVGLTLAMMFAHDRKTKTMLFAGVVISVSISIVGNIYVAKPPTTGDIFLISWSWLDAIAPPLLTIFASWALKGRLLHMATLSDAPEVEYPPLPQAKELHLHVETPLLAQKGGQVLLDESSVYVSTCPHCQREFSKPTKKQADRALNTHLKKCQALTMSLFSDAQFKEMNHE